jgi:hypothetical protein
MSELAALSAIATRVRQALECASREELLENWTAFPRGTCGDTSLVLCAFLADAGFAGFELVCGERGSHEGGTYSSHAWLQRDQLVVDITADQFMDGPGPVVVADASEWHRGFYVSSKDIGDFREYPVEQVVKLHTLYHRLKMRIDASTSGLNFSS